MEFTVIDGCLIAMLVIVLLFFIGANNQRKREQKKVQRLYDAVHLLYRLRVERHINPLLSRRNYTEQQRSYIAVLEAVDVLFLEANDIINELPLPL